MKRERRVRRTESTRNGRPVLDYASTAIYGGSKGRRARKGLVESEIPWWGLVGQEEVTKYTTGTG